jgi:hypothetical protein
VPLQITFTGRRSEPAGSVPLPPKRKWQAITVSTVLLVPAYWSMLAGAVGFALDDAEDEPNSGALFALGLAIIPFVFVVLAFMSEHPRAPGAAAKAMALSLLVGVLVTALAADPVTGMVAGVGAGAVVALRPEPDQGLRPRIYGVAVATAYTFVLVRTVGSFALLSAPVFPVTAVGLADHLVAWWREREDAYSRR